MFMLLALLLSTSAYAAPIELTWQGRLTDLNGTPINGAVPLTVTLYGSESGSDDRWDDTFSTSISDGFFAVILGSDETLDNDLFATGELWVEVVSDTTTFGGRKRLSHVPMAAVSAGVRVEGAPASQTCAGQLGAMVYDTSIQSLRICDGTEWVGATGPDRGVMITVEGAIQYADGTTAHSCEDYRHPAVGNLHDASTTDGPYVIDPDDVGTLAPITVYCDMSTDGGGWTLISNRRANASNIETCGSNLNGFFTNGCGDVSNITPTDSYAMTATYRSALGAMELLHTQYSTSSVLDSDDAYILLLNSSSTDLFPVNGNSNNIAVAQVCTLDRGTCDTTDVYWKYLGTGYYGSSFCDGGQDNAHYGGNYGVCHNGVSSTYESGSFTGNRTAYDETKLWDLTNGQEWNERLWMR